MGVEVPENEAAAAVVDAAVHVHRAWGPGLLESAYLGALARELALRGHRVDREVAVPVEWRGESVGPGFRLDLLVDRCLVVEGKAVSKLDPVHHRQLLTYLKLTKLRLGLLLNFGAPRMKDGIVRIANGMP